MNTQLLKSVSFIAIVLVLGVGATYAAFTSNTVTISNNTFATGSANIKLCNGAGVGWNDTINPSLSLANLSPGDSDIELTAGQDLYLGNDDGTLDNNNDTTGCNNYAPGATLGESTVAMNFVPKLSSPTCDPVELGDELSLKFQFNGGNDTGYKTLNEWVANAAPFGPVLQPDQQTEVTVYAALNSASDNQNAECTFDIQFTGEQSV